MTTVFNVISNWAAFVIGTAITFFLSPFVVHSLGDTRYGVWGVIGSIVGYLGLLDLGMRVGVTRFVAAHHATGDRAALNRVMSTALGMFTVAGAVAIVIGLLLSISLRRFTDVPAGLAHESATAVAIGGVTVACGLIGGVFGGYLNGRQRFAAVNIIDLGTEGARALTVVAALQAGGGLIVLSLIQLGAVLTRGLLYLVASRRLPPAIQLARTHWSGGTLRQILRFSSYTMILHMCTMVIFSSDAVVIAALMPVAQVTYFAIGANLIQAAQQVVSGVSRVLYPLVSARQAVDGIAGTTWLVRDSVRLSTITVLPVLVTFFLRGSTFIALWMGPAYAEPAGQVLQILAAGLCFIVSYLVLTSSVMALNLHGGLVAPFIIEAAANLGTSIALGYYYGINGVALGTTLPRLAVAFGFAPWFARRRLGIGVAEYATHAWVRPLASMIPFAIASAMVDRFWRAGSLAVFFAQVAVVLPLAALGAWIVGLEQRERDMIRRGLSGGRREAEEAAPPPGHAPRASSADRSESEK